VDPLITVASACVGAAVTSALHFVIPYIRHKPNNNNGNGSNGSHRREATSGQLSPQDWEGRIAKLHEASEERLMSDIRSLMNNRTLTLVEKVTQPIVNEIRALRDDLSRRSDRRN